MNTFSHKGKRWKVESCTETRLVAVPAVDLVAVKQGQALAAIREKLGLNTRDMALKLNISQSKLVKLEKAQQWRSLPAVLEQARKL